MKKPRLNLSLVAFIDILGFKSKLQKMTSQKELEAIYGQLHFIQDEFDKNIDRERRNDHRYSGKEVLAFSDCVVVSIRFNSRDEKYFGSFDSLMGQLHGIGLSQSICVCSDIFLRGGISIGGWFHQRDILISTAMSEAYEHERIKTKYPIIGISNNTYNYFRKHPHRARYTADIDPVEALFFRYRTKDKHLRYGLDYLKIGFDASATWHTKEDLELYKKANDNIVKDNILNDSYNRSQIYYLNQHKMIILRGLRTAGRNKSIRDKYLWLAKYHNRYVSGLDNYFRTAKIMKSEVLHSTEKP